MSTFADTIIPSDSTEPEPFRVQFCADDSDTVGRRGRLVVWKFGGSSVANPVRLRRVAQRLVAAKREGLQVVAVLSAMGDSTDALMRLAYEMSPKPQPRELDALLSVGESASCALAAIAVHDLGERAVSLTGSQAGVFTDELHGNARLEWINPERIIEALDQCAIVLVTGFLGVSVKGDVTTLGRGGSDVSAVALASALDLRECDIFTDVPGVFTADPWVVPGARKLTSVSHAEMLQLVDAGTRVIQGRAVELAAAHDIALHVRSSFTFEPGTRVKRTIPVSKMERITGIAYIRRDPVYTVTNLSPATVTAALTQRRVRISSIVRDGDKVRFTVPEINSSRVIGLLADLDVDVAAPDELGSVSIVTTMVTNQSDIIGSALSALKHRSVDVHLVTSTPSRVSCHVHAADVNQAARILHEAFELNVSDEERETQLLTAAPSLNCGFRRLAGSLSEGV